MRQMIIVAILLSLLCPANSFALSDKLYNQCMREKVFKDADNTMNKNWKRLRSLLDESDFKYLLADQRKWVRNGRELEIDYIIDDYGDIDICSLYAISTYARAVLLGRIATFIQRNPDYSHDDIDTFMRDLDYLDILNKAAQRVTGRSVAQELETRPQDNFMEEEPEQEAPTSGRSDEQYQQSSVGSGIAGRSQDSEASVSTHDAFTDEVIEKAKDAAIEKAVDIGVRFLLK